MSQQPDRRRFLQHSCCLGGSLLAAGIPFSRPVHGAPVRIDAPIIDELTVREITDNSHDIFLRPSETPGLTVRRTGFPQAPQGRTLESEWGLALALESHKGQASRRYLLDFGFTPKIYANNLDVLKIDVGQVDALIVSHGHYDHIGGLTGFLEANRPRMREELKLYCGGEDTFCGRSLRNPDGSFTGFGTPLDRQRLKALDVQAVLSEVPIVMEGHAFTTGAVPRTSMEHVLPNTWVTHGVQNGLGCDTHAYMSHHFSEEELAGKPVPDQHWHEHATCFRLGDRGLVVISSCGHAGIINTLKRAQEISGVDKIYALMGGFHLAPAPSDYLAKVMAELKKFDLQHVMPMHCSGQNFIDLARQEIPDKLVLCATGSSYTFTA
ncbi:MAG TPA: MBL fold metallo-hydrolase [Burkholderiaceae bacterium]|nr:MBL fold metallo-hydrolase [Burkholderiaceae bacterium]